jgi:hypothetical protein
MSADRLRSLLNKEGASMAYTYRNLPCTASRDGWCVVGYDRQTDAGGILEWCRNERDARDTYAEMMKDEGRFDRLCVDRLGAENMA